MDSNKVLRDGKKAFPEGVSNFTGFGSDISSIPFYIKSANGSKVTPLVGKKLIDFDLGGGSHILGYQNKDIIKIVSKVLQSGFGAGHCTGYEVELARAIQKEQPVLERLCFSNSRSDAISATLRIAKAITKKDKVLKFRGAYHGQLNEFQVGLGFGNTALNAPDRPGVSRTQVLDTIVAEYNNSMDVKRIFKRFDKGLAAVVIEPIATSFGLVRPNENFIDTIKQLAHEHKTLIISDESVSTLRLFPEAKWVQTFGDLKIVGPAIGGMFPLYAFGGSVVNMSVLKGKQPVFFDGLFSASAVSCASGLTVMKKIDKKALLYLSNLAGMCAEGVKKNIKKLNRPYNIQHVGSMFSLMFMNNSDGSGYDKSSQHIKLYPKYFKLMKEQGILLPTNPNSPCFLSLAHSEQDVKSFIKANLNVLKKL